MNPNPNQKKTAVFKSPTLASLFRPALVVIPAAFLSAHAGVFYDESASGDLTGTFSAPHQGGDVSPGSNTISGSSVSTDRDYITFSVPTGSVVSSILLTQFVSTDDLMFVGLTVGSSSIDPATALSNIGSLLGYTHPGTASTPALLGTDILDEIGAGDGAIGFTGGLGPGTYTLWLQQTSPQNVSYTFDLTSVPEPAAVSGTVASLLLGAALVRRLRASSGATTA